MIESTAPAANTLQKPYRLERCRPEEAAALARVIKEDDTNSALQVLSRAELRIVRGFAADKRRIDWLAGRIATKRLMSWCLAQEGVYLKMPSIEVFNRQDGSPYVRLPTGEEFARYPFSLSHSKAGGVTAVAQPGFRIGVDLETIEPREKSFLQTMAHDTEWDLTMETDPAEQTRLWTLKEAVSKLLGLGLSVGFWDIRFPLTGDERRLELHGPALARYKAIGKPTIHFDSFTEAEDVLSVAYTTQEDTDA